MKLLKKRDYTGTVRKIVNDDKTEVLGIVGTFKDLMEIGVVESATREEAIQNTLFVKKSWEEKL